MEKLVLSADYSDSVSLKPLHYHDCHQILFVTSGNARIVINGNAMEAKRGDLFLISRFEQHSVEKQSLDYRRYILEITPNIPLDSVESSKVYAVLFNRPHGFSNVHSVWERFQEYQDIFASIVLEYTMVELLRENMLNLLVQQLLIKIGRTRPSIMAAVEGDCLAIVSQVQNYMQSNFSQYITLQDLAQKSNISVSYLSHLFKNATGKSVMGYLLSCRLAAAKNLLVHTNLSVSEIVDSCGFSDCSNFSRTFRQNTGMSPLAFRKTYR